MKTTRPSLQKPPEPSAGLKRQDGTLLLAIDVGTTELKAAVIPARGGPCRAQEARRIPMLSPEPAVSAVEDQAVAAEMAADHERFLGDIDQETHARAVRVGLGLRRYLDTQGFNALSANFLAFNSGREPVNTFPFLELSKAMNRGIGYAGEGDVLTATLVGALLSAFPQTTFTEMFCPDWKGGHVFLSHMGEVNPAVLTGKPLLVRRDWPFSDALPPALITGAMQPGPATLVNLAPGPNDSFSLILAPVEVLDDGTHPDMADKIRGGIRPAMPVATFLETYSRHGGTHHCALVLGHRVEELRAFARGINVDAVII